MLIISCVRVTRALGAILVLQWLQTLSAEVLEETCTKGTDGEYQDCKGRKKLVQKATKVSLATRGQSDLSTKASGQRRRRRRKKVAKKNTMDGRVLP